MRVRARICYPLLVACTKRLSTPHAASITSVPRPPATATTVSSFGSDPATFTADPFDAAEVSAMAMTASAEQATAMKGGSWFRIKTGRPASEQPIILEAHRGGGEHMMENEIPAFLYGASQGVDSVEFDVWLTSDNKLAISHGPDVEGIARDYDVPTYEGLKLMNENDNIPLLEDVIDVCLEHNLFMNVEIKPDNAAVSDMVIDMLKDKGAMHLAVISSFERSVLARAIEIGGIGVGSLFSGGYIAEDGSKQRHPPPADMASWVVEQRKKNGQEVHPHDTLNFCIEKVKPEYITEAQKHGLGAMIWFPMTTDTDEHIALSLSLMQNFGGQGQRKVLCVNKLDKFMKGIADVAGASMIQNDGMRAEHKETSPTGGSTTISALSTEEPKI